MSSVALIDPMTLLGEELRERLEQRPDLALDLRLLSADEDQVGALTTVGGAAAMVGKAEGDDLANLDLAIFCGSDLRLLADLPPAATAIVASPGTPVDEAIPVIAGVNESRAERGRRLLSPHPSAVLLGHLLGPLASFAPQSIVATLIEPASIYGKQGLDDLFDQARALVALTQVPTTETFERQLAFNLYPATSPGEGIADELRAALSRDDLALRLQRLQAPVFHGISVHLTVELDGPWSLQEVSEALAAHPWNELAEDGDRIGPIDAANHESVLIGGLAQSGERHFGLWAVMDNLTRGGALNMLRILDLLSGGTAS
ncbi:MAG: Asd/ArgC dimerization domain-containing protein [Acidobacteriota bacterium]